MDQIEQFTGEMLVCGLLSALLQKQPDKARLQAWMDEDIFSESPLGEDQADINKGLALLQAWRRDVWVANPDQAFEAVESDYMRLFVGMGRMLAAPWESIYFSEEQQLFQEETLQVRAWYRKFGLQVEQLHHEPDDHIGLELGFMAYLAQLTVQALEQGDQAQAASLMAEQRAFVEEHPLRWVASWCALVDQHARTDFYRGAAFLTLGTVQEVASILQTAG